MSAGPSSLSLDGPNRAALLSMPLLPGWTEHVGPQGQLYWYNETTEESTYSRPVRDRDSTGERSLPQQSLNTRKCAEPEQNFESKRKVQSKRKKEKPKTKEPIDGADGWLMVTTNYGNVFYAHLPTKRSEWEVPQEIREYVDRLQLRKESNPTHFGKFSHLQEATKRKRESRHEVPGQGNHATNDPISQENEKKVRVTPIADDPEEALWPKRLAANRIHASINAGDSASHSKLTSIDPDTSNKERRIQFMHMLTSLNGTAQEVNPMMPWDRELPKFDQHLDYTIIPSLRDRQELFNEWCRDRIQQKRAGTQSAAHDTQSLSGSFGSKESQAEFDNLLKKEVKSTRTTWDDFRKIWRKDRRFYQFGRDDRDREKAFRAWLRELGRQKQKAAEQAEKSFVDLLNEKLSHDARCRLFRNASAEEGASCWSQAKLSEGLASDPRYDAVGSSSRRSELFIEWAKGNMRDDVKRASPKDQTFADERVTGTKRTEHSTARALQERTEKVQRQQAEAERQRHRSYGFAQREDSITRFQQLLIDAVREPLASLGSTFDTISRDERFNASGLHGHDKENLFWQHVKELNRRRREELERVFERHAVDLSTEEDVAIPLIKDDDEIQRKRLTDIHEIHYERKTLENVFREWQERRENGAKNDFVQMLKENAFVEFWGRLRKELAQKKQSGQESAEANPGDDEDGEGAGAPTLLQMAAQIDLDEIDAILRNDARYRAWRHKPELREQWIRHHLQQMDIPKMSHFNI